MLTKAKNEMTSDESKLILMSDDDLLREIRARLSVCAESLIHLAKAVGVAMRRGLDLSGLAAPMLLDVLRKIESGQILPELAERYMHTIVFHRLKTLPIDDQRRIAEKGTVEVVVRRGDDFDVRKLQVDALTQEQSRLVFTSGRIRTRAEQTAILEDQATEQVEDPFDESLVTVRLTAEIEMTKAQRRVLAELREKAGGMSELVRRLIMAKL